MCSLAVKNVRGEVEEYSSFKSFAKITACCCYLKISNWIFLVIFEFRNLASMLFNFFEKFLETPGVVVVYLYESASFVGERTMRLSASCSREL